MDASITMDQITEGYRMYSQKALIEVEDTYSKKMKAQASMRGLRNLRVPSYWSRTWILNETDKH